MDSVSMERMNIKQVGLGGGFNIMKRFYVMIFSAALLAAFFGLQTQSYADGPIYGYWDWGLFENNVGAETEDEPNDLDYTSYGNVRSLYEMERQAHEGRGSFMFLQYFPPRHPYYIEQRFTDILDAIGQFTDANDLAYIQISDESYLAGMTKAEAEQMIAHAKSRLPGYKFAMSFGGLMRPDQGPGGTGANAEAKGGFPRNLDIAMMNWAPFTAGNPNGIPADQNEFDEQTKALLDKYLPLTDPNTELMFTTQIYVNNTDPCQALPPNSVAWYANWVDSNDLAGMVLYSWYGSPGEVSGRELEARYGGYVDAQRQVGYDWGISTSVTLPYAHPPELPSTFDRQKWNTTSGHDGWSNHCGSVAWIGVYTDEAHGGVQSLRCRSTNQQSNATTREVPAEAREYGELEMYVKVTAMAGNASQQIVAFFPTYDPNNSSGYGVSGTQQVIVLVWPGLSNNYLIKHGVQAFPPDDTGFPVTGGWDHIVVKWDAATATGNNASGDTYLLWVNGDGPYPMQGPPYSGADSIGAVRVFISQDGTIGNDGGVYDPPPGFEMWVDDVDMEEGEPIILDCNCPFVETWETVTSYKRMYPYCWSHTGGGTPGEVLAGYGVGGGKAMRLVGEGGAQDGYYRYFYDTNEGSVEFDFSIEDKQGSILIMEVGNYDGSKRFELYCDDINDTYKYIYGSWFQTDTGIALPGSDEFHHIVYKWHCDNTDELIIDGQVVPQPGGWVNHRAYDWVLNAERVKFALGSTGTIAIWDNIAIRGPEGNLDCCYDIDLPDYAVLASQWGRSDCSYPFWCNGADMDRDFDVDYSDLRDFVEQWLWLWIERE